MRVHRLDAKFIVNVVDLYKAEQFRRRLSDSPGAVNEASSRAPVDGFLESLWAWQDYDERPKAT